MAEQAGAELTEDDDLDEEVEELEPQTDQAAGDNQDNAPEGDEDEVEVTFGDEAAPASGEGRETSEFKRLRDHSREQARRIAELERQAPQAKPIEIGEEPTYEGCEYDSDRYKAELLAWNARKVEADKANAKRDQDSQAQRDEFNADLQRFSKGKTELKARDFDLAESAVQAALDTVQLSTLVVAAKDSAKLIYALGKHPEKLKALAAIKNPIKLAAAVPLLEGSMKFASKSRRAPEPEGIVRGGAPITQKVDKELERLRSEAQRTGDYTKVGAYKREQRSKAK